MELLSHATSLPLKIKIAGYLVASSSLCPSNLPLLCGRLFLSVSFPLPNKWTQEVRFMTDSINMRPHRTLVAKLSHQPSTMNITKRQSSVLALPLLPRQPHCQSITAILPHKRKIQIVISYKPLFSKWLKKLILRYCFSWWKERYPGIILITSL